MHGYDTWRDGARGLQHERGGERGERGGEGGAPGKRTLTAQLVAQRKAVDGGATVGKVGGAACVEGAGGAPIADPFWFAGGGSPLPAATRQKMEEALGADLSQVRIHQDGLAEQMGAVAFARGTNVHFARGAFDPSSERGLQVLGHELVHVVQQQRGSVGATGRVGDAEINDDESLESEADRLGAAAARGERVSIGGGRSGAGSSGGAVAQGMFVAKANRLPHPIGGLGIGDEVRISDDGSLGLHEQKGGAKWFMATQERIDEANDVLDAVSDYELVTDGASYKLPSLNNVERDVERVVARRRDQPLSRGDTLTGPERCNEMAASVVGGAQLGRTTETNVQRSDIDTMGLDLAEYMAAYDTDEDRRDGEEAVTGRRDDIGKHSKDLEVVKRRAYHLKPEDKEVRKKIKAFQGNPLTDRLQQLSNTKPAILKVDGNSTEGLKCTKDGKVRVILLDDGLGLLALTQLRDVENLVSSYKRKDLVEVARPDGSFMKKRDLVTAQRYKNLGKARRTELSRDLKLNQFAQPDIGQAFGIFPVGEGDGTGFPYHWAGVVARAGADTVTLENFWRGGGGEAKNFFGMYGPLTHTHVSFGGVVTAQVTSDEEKASGSFHQQWEGNFVDHGTKAITASYGGPTRVIPGPLPHPGVPVPNGGAMTVVPLARYWKTRWEETGAKSDAQRAYDELHRCLPLINSLHDVALVEFQWVYPFYRDMETAKGQPNVTRPKESSWGAPTSKTQAPPPIVLPLAPPGHVEMASRIDGLWQAWGGLGHQDERQAVAQTLAMLRDSDSAAFHYVCEQSNVRLGRVTTMLTAL